MRDGLVAVGQGLVGSSFIRDLRVIRGWDFWRPAGSGNFGF